jgi:hypothetical protein
MNASDEHHGSIVVALAAVIGVEGELSDAVAYMFPGVRACCEAHVRHVWWWQWDRKT